MKVAIVGSGISGLGCAHALLAEQRHGVRVTLFEAERRLGGHTNTVDVRLDGVEHPVDTGFLVFNARTYPNLIRLLAELGVPTAKSDMSFAVSVPAAAGRRVEWAGTELAGVFAQRRNLASPRFLGMLADILRFNRQATRIAQGAETAGEQTLGEFLKRHRYCENFRVPAVLLDTPVAREVCGPAARYVPAGDIQSIAAALVELLHSPAARAEVLGEASGVLSRYSWPEAARRTMDALESVCR